MPLPVTASTMPRSKLPSLHSHTTCFPMGVLAHLSLLAGLEDRTDQQSPRLLLNRLSTTFGQEH